MRISPSIHSSQTLYLLREDPFSSLHFERYRQLIEKCQSVGAFLSLDKDADWFCCYERDSQSLHAKLPLLVFRPDEASGIPLFLQACSELNIPVTIRCGGTGLAGSCVPSSESVVLLTQHLRKIKEYDIAKGSVVIEPGVTVRQLNDYVQSGNWTFPLKMASEGVAGMAGCLSSQARGYHQQEQAFFDSVEDVTLVDGQGKIHHVPSFLVCGAEGLWGVIIEIKIRLKKKPPVKQELIYLGSWKELLIQLPKLRSLQALVSMTYLQSCFYLKIEGESWRVPSTVDRLNVWLQEIQPFQGSFEQLMHAFMPSRQSFIALSSVFGSLQLPEACEWSKAEAQELGLECVQQADILAGSLHLILQSQEDKFSFARKAETFLISWINFVDRQRGVLASCHGVGMQMNAYMTPFWTEETQSMWRHLQSAFDPKGLLGKERFFPLPGKSVEFVLENRSSE